MTNRARCIPEKLADSVKKYRADIGVSLDGDADRVILVDEEGSIVNGDHILAISALHLKKKNKLVKNTVVATLMSNYGLNKVLNAHGIEVVRTAVGDKYVVEEMRQNGFILGGEQSGHIIFLDHSTTGDGCVAALNVFAIMKEQNKKLSELREIMEDVPQVLINVKVKHRKELETIKGYKELIKDIEKSLKGQGRVLVRFSGTENVLRILVEGSDRKMIAQFAETIAKFVEKKFWANESSHCAFPCLLIFCEKLKSNFAQKQLVLLNGPLGVGKTQFVKSMVSTMGGEMPDSPTFSIINQYPCPDKTIYHVDLYRLESEADVESTGFWDLFREDEALIFVEWAERIADDNWPHSWSRLDLQITFSNKVDEREIHWDVF
jgi:tRNA threonylcarbamoyl adenosine modification protein YjeE